MTVEERMQTIRVRNMVQRHPEFAKELGITCYVDGKTGKIDNTSEVLDGKYRSRKRNRAV